MQTMILAVVVLGVMILAMSIGVIMGRKPIKGSCGGVGAALGEKDYICPVCGDDPNLCESEENAIDKVYKDAEAGLAYEAKGASK